MVINFYELEHTVITANDSKSYFQNFSTKKEAYSKMVAEYKKTVNDGIMKLSSEYYNPDIKSTLAALSASVEIGEVKHFWSCDTRRVNITDDLQKMVETVNGKTRIEKAAQCLVDNGIDADEAMTVLQSIGYILADVDLWPEAQDADKDTLRPGMKPDDFQTGAHVKTPRGLFTETALSVAQMESLGYGEHHRSPGGEYKIMGNGTRAFAVRIEQTPEMKAYCRRVIAGEEQ